MANILSTEKTSREHKQWLKSQVTFHIAEAKKTWGDGWRQLTPEMQEAFVCQKLVYRLLGQVTDFIQDPAKFKTLWENNIEVIRETLKAVRPEEQ